MGLSQVLLRDYYWMLPWDLAVFTVAISLMGMLNQRTSLCADTQLDIMLRSYRTLAYPLYIQPLGGIIIFLAAHGYGAPQKLAISSLFLGFSLRMCSPLD